jgi:hypothetical protein
VQWFRNQLFKMGIIIHRIWTPRIIGGVQLGSTGSTGTWNTDCLANLTNTNNVSMIVGVKNTFLTSKRQYTHIKCMDFVPGIQMDTFQGTVLSWCDSYTNTLSYCLAKNTCPKNQVNSSNIMYSYLENCHQPDFLAPPVFIYTRI